MRAAKERTPQRLRAGPAVRWRGAGCVRMRRMEASYPQHIGRRAPKAADAPGRVARVSPDAIWATGGADVFAEDAGWGQPYVRRRPRGQGPPRSVHFRTEIGSVPRRDRFTSAPRSVRRTDLSEGAAKSGDPATQSGRRMREDCRAVKRASSKGPLRRGRAPTAPPRPRTRRQPPRTSPHLSPAQRRRT